MTKDAQHGGLTSTCDATNDAEAQESCNTQPCPIDCSGSWGDWSNCTATCGGGTTSRSFTIRQKAQNGGRKDTCPLIIAETSRCNLNSCPVDCAGEWSAWGSCSVTCGGGSETRMYRVTMPAQYGGLATTCDAVDETVETQSCNSNCCPSPCVGAWGDWGACSAGCDGLDAPGLPGGGEKSKTFAVTTPAACGGQECIALDGTALRDGSVETVKCNTEKCEYPVDCKGEWGPWSSLCSLPCDDGVSGPGSRTRTYTVTEEAANGGSTATCAATDGFVQSGQCNVEWCPIDCSGSWSGWSSCSATCGLDGLREQTYTVSQPAAHGGQTGTCDAADGVVAQERCNTQPCPIDCVGTWTNWTACTEPLCGGGTRTKTYAIEQFAQHGGRKDTCLSWMDLGLGGMFISLAVTAQCNMNPCPVDCAGEWSAWGSCSVTCGTGTRERTYSVTSPAQYGGLATTCAAVDDAVAAESCTLDPCPIPCVGAWGDWGACTAECTGEVRLGGLGEGVSPQKTRVFAVTQPLLYGGQACVESDGVV